MPQSVFHRNTRGTLSYGSLFAGGIATEDGAHPPTSSPHEAPSASNTGRYAPR